MTEPVYFEEGYVATDNVWRYRIVEEPETFIYRALRRENDGKWREISFAGAVSKRYTRKGDLTKFLNESKKRYPNHDHKIQKGRVSWEDM